MISPNFNDAAKSIAAGPDAIDGHVSQKTKQLFKVERTREIKHPKLNIEAVEWILEDQFGNKYFLFRSMLFDGELYDVAQWFWCGGIDRLGLVGDFRQFKTVNDALIDFARDSAFIAFARTNLLILRARKKSTSPQTLEPKDMTRKANGLAKAIIAAGRIAQAGPKDPMALLKIDPPTQAGLKAHPVKTALTEGTLFSFPTQPKPDIVT